MKNTAALACYLLYSTLISFSHARATRGHRNNVYKLNKRGYGSSEETTAVVAAIDFPETQIERTPHQVIRVNDCAQYHQHVSFADVGDLASYPAASLGEESCAGLDVPMVMARGAAGEEEEEYGGGTRGDPLGRVRSFTRGMIEEESALGRCPSTTEVAVLRGKSIGTAAECTVHLTHKVCSCDRHR